MTASDIRQARLTRKWSLGAVLVAALMRGRRKLALRDGGLVVTAGRPGLQRALARAGLEVAYDLEDG